MNLSNEKKAEISYSHSHEIQKIFTKYIKGEMCLDHFSINVVLPNDDVIFLSPTPKMAEELCKKNFVNHDSNYKKESYEKYTIYPWRSVEKHKMDSVINHLKEEKFCMHNGMMIVRNIGNGCYVMYSFATHKKEKFSGQLYFLYHCKANYIAEMGDYMYNELNQIVNFYAQESNIIMPKIDRFKSIDLEASFSTNRQRELFYTINNSQNDFLQKTPNKVPPNLILINGGKIER